MQLFKCNNGKVPTPQYLSHGSLGRYHYQERQDVSLLTAVRAMEPRRERLALRECNCVALQCSHRWFLPPSLYILIVVIDVSEDMSCQVKFKVYIAVQTQSPLQIGCRTQHVLRSCIQVKDTYLIHTLWNRSVTKQVKTHSELYETPSWWHFLKMPYRVYERQKRTTAKKSQGQKFDI